MRKRLPSRILPIIVLVMLAVGLCPGLALAAQDSESGVFVPGSAQGLSSQPGEAETQAKSDVAAVKGAVANAVARMVTASGDESGDSDSGIVASGTCGTEGDNVVWSLDSAGVLTVSGSGEMADGRIAKDYAKQVTSIVIEQGVTSVGDSAFQEMQSAASVTFPNGLEKVGKSSFWNCGSLSTVTLPDTLTELGTSAFAKCEYLRSIYFPDSLDEVPGGVCSSCSKLTSVHLPSNAKTIGSNAFYFATSLRSVSLPASLERIESAAFRSCPLLTVTFPSTLEYIGESAFYGNYMSVITVPGSVKTIASRAFFRSYGATSITLSEGVESIGSEAFCDSRMTSLTLPASLTSIGPKPFVRCSNLAVVTIAEGNDAYEMRGKGLYTKDGTKLVACLSSAEGTFVIPEGVTTLVQGCFDSCNSISAISIPASLEAGNESALHIVDEFNQSSWKALSSYEVADGNQAYQAIGGVLFNKAGDTLVLFPVGAVNASNYQDGSACCYTIPDGVSKIGAGAFSGSRLQNIVVPVSVTEIGSGALAVVDTSNGGRIRYAGTANQWGQIEFGSSMTNYTIAYDTVAFASTSNWLYCSLNSEGTLTLSGRTSSSTLNMPAFEEGEAPWASWVSQVKELVVNGNITSIAAGAFSGFSELKRASFPSSLRSVGAGAFSGCSSLLEVVCDGDPFEVEAASLDNPSFPAAATLVFYPGLGTWQADEAFDSEAMTWNGYRMTATAIPEIGSIVLDRYAVSAQGNASSWYTTSIGVTVLSTDGEDITENVTVSVSHSAGFDTRRHPMLDNGQTLVYHEVSYDSLAQAVTVGRNAYADAYVVSASADGMRVSGDPVRTTLSISRPAEFLAGVTSWTSPKITNRSGSGPIKLVRFENQFSEEFTGKNYVFSASCSSPYKDITEDLESYGLYRIGNQVYASQRTPSGTYSFGLRDAKGVGASGSTTVTNTVVWHTATFKAGSQVVDTVAFPQGASSLDEPAVPDRENYHGAWESYDLSAATGDITVNAVYTPIDTGAVSEVDATAEESDNGDGTKTIVLSAIARTQTVRVEKLNAKPLDVVLVLDQSGSMADTLSASDARSKRDALVQCAGDFLEKLHDNAKATGADHRVALVGFAYSAYNGGSYRNTGLLATADGSAKGYDSLSVGDYAAALLPIDVSGSLNPAVSAGIGRVVADGATAADLGLKMARNIFSTQGAAGERERVVVFITDGTPTCWGETSQLIERTAAAAISEAGYIKGSQGARVYAVGVHEQADPAAAFNGIANGVATDAHGRFESYDFNRFMHSISSNYPDAVSMATLGEGDKGAGYYLGVTDTSTLSNIFRDILYTTVYETKVFDRATISCKLAAGVELEWGQERAICEGLGLAAGDVTVTRNDDGTCDIVMRNVPVSLADDGTGALVYQARLSFQVTVEGQAAVAEVRATVTDRSEVGGQASYSDAHEHSYVEVSRTGTCKEGVIAHFVCSCGAEKDEVAIASEEEHEYVAALTSDSGLSTSVERLVCSKCGHVVEKNINYQVTYSKSFRTAVLDLSLLENEAVVQPDGSIEMRFYVGDTSGRSYTVTRIAPDGTKTVYRTRLEDGWLVFDADHFSVYTVAEVDESGQLATEEISYEKALEALSGVEVDLAPAPTDISSAKVTVAQSSFTYTGSAITPDVTVTLNGSALPTSAYDVAYADNTAVGTATVTVTGKGDYTGTAEATFAIAKAEQSGNVASGTWGTCPWEITNDGVLTVHPGTGADHSGEEGYYPYTNYGCPWASYNDAITRVVFVSENGAKVVAPENVCGLLERLTALTSVDLSGLDTSSVTYMDQMFMDCSLLESVDFTGLDTSNVVSMQGLFFRCTSLAAVNLSSVDTSNVVQMFQMFLGCSSLTSLDLSSFDTANVGFTYAMFYGCSALKTITVGDAWSMANPSLVGVNARAMFEGCTSLVGGNGTKYDANHTDTEYARVDAASSPGYLTAIGQQPAKTDISSAEVTLSQSSYTYDGKAKTPGVTVTLDGSALPASAYDVAYANNTAVGTATVTVTGKGDYEGAAKTTFAIVAPEKRVMHRLYNPNSGEHFYTSDEAEYKNVKAAGWNDEGTGWTAPSTSGTPVYRLYNKYGGEHHYTTSASERDFLVKAGWNDEGVGWYSDDAKTVPLYREYNPNAFANNHNYTTSKQEHDHLVSLGWRDEGYAWYGV